MFAAGAVAELAGQVVEGHGPAAGLIAERVSDEAPAVFFDGRKEGDVDGRLYDDRIPGLRQSADTEAERGDDTRSQGQPLAADLPAVPRLEPADDRLPE
jgi:hypothetical protein